MPRNGKYLKILETKNRNIKLNIQTLFFYLVLPFIFGLE